MEKKERKRETHLVDFIYLFPHFLNALALALFTNHKDQE